MVNRNLSADTPTWRRRLLILGACIGIAMTALVAPTAAAAEGFATSSISNASFSNASFSYSCYHSLTVCRQAGITAGSSAADVAKYLEKQRPSGASINLGGYGYTTNFNPPANRSYGWRLSRNTAGIMLNYYRCQVVNGYLTDCVYYGDVAVQATYGFNGHLVRGITATMTNFTSVPLGVAHAVVCLPASENCRSEALSYYGAMAPSGGQHSNTFIAQYLPEAGPYQMVFIWSVYDPGIISTALTPPYYSLVFQCEPLGPYENPGECYFDGEQEGTLE